MLPGGSAFPRTTLEPHPTTRLTFNGLTDVTFIRVGDEEKPGEAHNRSVAAAEREIDRYIAARWGRTELHASSSPSSLPRPQTPSPVADTR